MAFIPLRLSELNERISDTINSAFDSVSFWVIADITNHSFKAQKNYHNFDLIEKDPLSNNIIARICGKAWGIGSLKIAYFEKVTGQLFTNNINVLINVSVQYHPVYGLQITLNDIDTNFTIGVLEQQKLATLLRLVNENPSFISSIGTEYITRNKQLSLKRVIQKIALISSSTSAGKEDFKHTLVNNPHGFHFQIDDYNTAVQGENNAKEFLNNLIAVYSSGIKYDVVVIIRGGGAQTDFLMFDNYYIGRAVAKFPIPIITGIGHQKNETITDLMAHTATKTPTKAAEFIISRNKSFKEALLNFQKNIIIKAQQILSHQLYSLNRVRNIIVNNSKDLLASNKDQLVMINQVAINKSKSKIFIERNALIQISARVIHNPRIVLYNRKNDLHNIVNNIKTFKSQYIKSRQVNLSHHSIIINLMNPGNILKKGFAIVKSNNKLTSIPDDIKVGDQIEVILAYSVIKSTVSEKKDYNGEANEL